jgi:GntR family transcriptional repressor for pyruvate dehydrogenase complex
VSNNTPTNPGSLRALPRQARLSDRVAARILDTILSERLAPGDPLPSERELGEQFGVSRTVIREAVRDLRARGLLDVRAGSRIKVAAVDQSIVHEAIRQFVRSRAVDAARVAELRDELLVVAAGLAAAGGPTADLDSLVSAVAQLGQAQGDVRAQAAAELRFLRAVIIAADNELLVVVYDSLADALSDTRPGAPAEGQGGYRGPLAAGPRALLDAVSRRDGAAAQRAMRAHLGQLLAPGRGNA